MIQRQRTHCRSFNHRRVLQIRSEYGPQRTNTDRYLSISLTGSVASGRAFVSFGASRLWGNAIEGPSQDLSGYAHICAWAMGQSPSPMQLSRSAWVMDSGAECILPGSTCGNAFAKSFNSRLTQSLQADLAGIFPVHTSSTAPISATFNS